jgi:LmbE family N-acetylglucosaminyl deacetylase
MFARRLMPIRQQRLTEFMADLARPGRSAIAANDVSIVVAHPDDETIGCGAQLARWIGATIVVVTDGAPRNLADARAYGFASASAYAAARRHELLAALSLADLPPSSVIQLGVPDQEAALQLTHLVAKLAELFAGLGTAVTVTHAYEGGHPDHDATAFAVHGAAAAAGAGIIEMPFYRAGHRGEQAQVLQRFAPGGPQEFCVPLSPGQQSLKARMVAAHASQARTLAPFAVDTERFRPGPAYNFAIPPNDGRLLYEQYDWGMTGARWLRLASAAKRQLAGGAVPCLPS